MSEFLPPVVIDITADDSDFISTVTKDQEFLKKFADSEVKALLGLNDYEFVTKIIDDTAKLKAMAGENVSAYLNLDDGMFQKTLADAVAEAKSIKNFDVGLTLNDTRFLAELAPVRAMAGKNIDVPLNLQSGGFFTQLMATIAEAKAAMALAGVGTPGKLGGAPWWASPVIGAAGAPSRGGYGGPLPVAAGGGDKRGGGLAGLLGIGAGFGGLGGFGTVMGASGIGIEGLLSAGIGVGASGIGALAGGGLLGGASLGVGAVGMGTDLAGIGQAAGDIKAVTAAQNALTAAVNQYGPASTRAANAQSNYNQVLAGFSPVAQGAVVQASQMATQFKQLFDQATGQAEKVGAEILTQAMKVGTQFLPEIGKAAATNMGIIQSSLQPLFTWLGGPGLKIFTDLENVFTQHLPTAVHMGTQAFELLARTIDALAPQTGKFIDTLDKLFTKMNGGGFDAWMVTVNKLITDFRDWEGLIKSIALAVQALFHNEAGTGQALVVTFTNLINRFTEWVNTSGTGIGSVNAMFQAHKAELISVINMLGTFLGAWGQIKVLVDPILMGLVGHLADFISWILKIPAVGPILAYVAAFALIANHLKALSIASTIISYFKGLKGAIQAMMTAGEAGGLMNVLKALVGINVAAKETTLADVVKAIEGLGVASEETAVAEGTTAGATGALSASMVLLSSVGIVAVVVGVYELIKHFGAVRGLLIAAAGGVLILAAAFLVLDLDPVVLAISAVIIGIAALVAGIIYLSTHWHEVWTDITNFVHDHIAIILVALSPLIVIFGPIIAAVVEFVAHWKGAFNDIKGAIRDFVGAIEEAWTWVTTAFTDVKNVIKAAVSDFPTMLLQAGKDLLTGLIHGMESIPVLGTIMHIGGSILSGFKSVLGVLSPSTYTTQMGSDVSQGLGNGITNNSAQAIAAAKSVSNQIIAAFGSVANAKNIQSAVGTLAGIFDNLAKAFTSLGKAAAATVNIGPNINAIEVASAALEKAAPAIVPAIQSMDKAFSKLGQNKDLTNLNGILGTLGTTFTDFGSLASSSASITGLAMLSIVTALQTIVAASKPISDGIDAIQKAFKKLDESKTVGPDMTSLAGIFTSLGTIFTNMSSMAQAAGGITVASITNVQGALLQLQIAAPGIVGAIQDLASKFGKLGDMAAIQKTLDGVNTALATLANIFTNLGSASSAVAQIAPKALGQVTDAIGNLATALGKLPTAVSAIKGPMVTNLTDVVNGCVDFLNGPGRSEFSGAGANMMDGLAAGISANAYKVQAQAAAAASSAAAAANAAIHAHSPSLVFAGIGDNMMTGMAKGITSGFAAHVVPAMDAMTKKLIDLANAGNIWAYADLLSMQSSTVNYGPMPTPQNPWGSPIRSGIGVLAGLGVTGGSKTPTTGTGTSTGAGDTTAVDIAALYRGFQDAGNGQGAVAFDNAIQQLQRYFASGNYGGTNQGFAAANNALIASVGSATAQSIFQQLYAAATSSASKPALPGAGLSSKNVSITYGDIHITTPTGSAQGIATSLTGALHAHDEKLMMAMNAL